MKRHFYSDSIENFITTTDENILGILAKENEFSLELTQKDSWLEQIEILKNVLKNYSGKMFFLPAV